MAIVLQIVCSILIILAVLYFLKRNDRSQTGASTGQMLLAAWQILFCGWFFAEFSEKINGYDTTKMSKEDYAYYLEVLNRVEKKMLDVAN